MCIFILGAGVQDEANSFKTFNPIFILRGNTREIVVGQTCFVKVEREGLVIFLEAYDPIDDMRPIFEGILVADEKIILVEDPENAGLQGLNKQQPGLLHELVQHLGGTLRKDHVLNALVLDAWQYYLHPLAGSDHREVHFFCQVRVLEDFKPYFPQGSKAPKSVNFLQLYEVAGLYCL